MLLTPKERISVLGLFLLLQLAFKVGFCPFYIPSSFSRSCSLHGKVKDVIIPDVSESFLTLTQLYCHFPWTVTIGDAGRGREGFLTLQTHFSLPPHRVPSQFSLGGLDQSLW